MAVVDIHTHMLTLDWVELLRAHGDKYSVKKTPGNQDAVHLYDAPFMTLMPGMWDYAMRIQNMDKAGVDIAVVSLTCPNVFWGGREVSIRAARMVNDSMAEQQRAIPDRIRWFASLPWQYPADAIAELARCVENGAVGVMVLGSIDGKALVDQQFAPIWSEIDRRALPVLVHPTAPPGVRDMHMEGFNLIPRWASCSIRHWPSRTSFSRDFSTNIAISNSSPRMAERRCRIWSDDSTSAMRKSRLAPP